MAIRVSNAAVVDTDNTLIIANLYGTSLDSKPTTGYANGSTFLEVDTGKIYLFNEGSSEWVELQ